MRALVDTNALIYLLDRKPKDDLRVRLEGLISEIENARGQLIIPTLVVAEYLVNADEARETLLNRLTGSRYVSVAPFDTKAALECADMDTAASAGGNKKAPFRKDRGADWQKIKVDRQVVAIARALKATVIGGDADVAAICTWAGVSHISVRDLPIPPHARQMHLVEHPLNQERVGSELPPTPV